MQGPSRTYGAMSSEALWLDPPLLLPATPRGLGCRPEWPCNGSFCAKGPGPHQSHLRLIDFDAHKVAAGRPVFLGSPRPYRKRTDTLPGWPRAVVPSKGAGPSPQRAIPAARVQEHTTYAVLGSLALPPAPPAGLAC